MAFLSFHSRWCADLKLSQLAILWVFSFLLVSVSNAQTLTDPSLRVNEVVGGLSQPTAMVFIGPGDLLILQKGDGRVRRVINGVLQAGEVLDVAVDTASETWASGRRTSPQLCFKLFCLPLLHAKQQCQ